MSNTRIIDMQQKKIISLHDQGYSLRKISKLLGVHRKTVTYYVEQHKASGIPAEKLILPEADIVGSLSIAPLAKERDSRYTSFKIFADQHRNQSKKTGFTIDNMYRDYKAMSLDKYYSRSQFYRLIQEIWNPPRGSLRLNNKYGDVLYVDYTGKKLSYVDKSTGEEIKVEILVTILPASQYIYMEAMASQRQEDFIQGIMNALEYIGGSPLCIVTDNLKSALTKAGKYQSIINKSLQGMALHYNTTIDPTRTYHPKDKALVEGAVKICYNSIFYEVQKHTYFSLAQLNAAIQKQLNKLNGRQLTHCDYSRKDQYEQEKTHQKPLPVYRYEVKQYRRAKVQKIGYVLCSEYKNYYSVPYRYIGKKVELRYDSRSLEIYHKSVRIASHITSQAKGQYVTITTHLASNNQVYVQWSPQYFSDLAAQYGDDVQSYVEGLEKAFLAMNNRFMMVTCTIEALICNFVIEIYHTTQKLVYF
jgi:lambda repressor-like predicted transcriptional regulator